MTRQLDSSIKAGQRKPGYETISKLSTRGTEEKTRAGVEIKYVCACTLVYTDMKCLLIVSEPWSNSGSMCACKNLERRDRASTSTLSSLTNTQLSAALACLSVRKWGYQHGQSKAEMVRSKMVCGAHVAVSQRANNAQDYHVPPTICMVRYEHVKKVWQCSFPTMTMKCFSVFVLDLLVLLGTQWWQWVVHRVMRSFDSCKVFFNHVYRRCGRLLNALELQNYQ